MARKLILTRGLPASGKTTAALKWLDEDRPNRARVNRDELRKQLFGKLSGLSSDEENYITQMQHTLARHYLVHRDVIVDDTNLNAKFAKEWLKLAAEVGVEVEWWDQFLEVPLSTCISRDMARTDNVGVEVIKSFYSRYFRGPGVGPKRPEMAVDELSTTRRYEGTPGKLKAFLVDLDGTIASNGPDRDNPNRGYYDWNRVGEDLPIEAIIDIVIRFMDSGLIPVFVSGRDAVCREQTLRWILTHVYNMSQILQDKFVEQGNLDGFIWLYMRPEGDNRKDSIVKLEIFDKYIRDNYDVQFAIDDRNQVVKAYRGIGLTVLQVADGDF